MKTLTLTALAFIVLASVSGCSEPIPAKKVNSSQAFSLSEGGPRFQILEIDGCQYVYRDAGYQEGACIAHKGNCKNPIHIK